MTPKSWQIRLPCSLYMDLRNNDNLNKLIGCTASDLSMLCWVTGNKKKRIVVKYTSKKLCNVVKLSATIPKITESILALNCLKLYFHFHYLPVSSKTQQSMPLLQNKAPIYTPNHLLGCRILQDTKSWLIRFSKINNENILILLYGYALKLLMHFFAYECIAFTHLVALCCLHVLILNAS